MPNSQTFNGFWITNFHRASFPNLSPGTGRKKWKNTADTETTERVYYFKVKTGLDRVFWIELSLHLKQWENTSCKQGSRNIKMTNRNLWTRATCKRHWHMGTCCLLLHYQTHALEDVCHPLYTVAKKFMSVFFVSGWHFPFSVFARLTLSICSSKMFFYPKTSKITLYFHSSLCYAVLLVTFMHWYEFFSLHYLFPAKLSVNLSQRNNVWPQFTSMSKRGNIWSFANGMSTATQRSIMFCSFQSCHVSTPHPSNDNSVPRQLKVSSFWGVKPQIHLKQISRDCSPLSLWTFLCSGKKN